MEGERAPMPMPLARARFRQFKNPPQPHMCIADTLRDSSEKLYINVLAWQKIPNPKQYSDPIPLYGGMKVPQATSVNSNKTSSSVFAVMVNPEILKVNGKNAANPGERDALVSLLCDFVEAMNPGLRLARRPVVLQERDLAGELKDVWLAVQAKREREKGTNSDYTYKVYDIDGVSPEDCDDEGSPAPPPQDSRRVPDRGCMLSQPLRDPRAVLHELDYYQSNQCSSSGHRFGRDNPALRCKPPEWPVLNPPTVDRTGGWDEYSKMNFSIANGGHGRRKESHGAEKERTESHNGQYDFYPAFATDGAGNGPADIRHSTDKIIAPMQMLALQSTENNCDNTTSDLSSVS